MGHDNWVFVISVVFTCVCCCYYCFVFCFLLYLELETTEEWFFQRVHQYIWVAAERKLGTLSIRIYNSLALGDNSWALKFDNFSEFQMPLVIAPPSLSVIMTHCIRKLICDSPLKQGHCNLTVTKVFVNLKKSVLQPTQIIEFLRNLKRCQDMFLIQQVSIKILAKLLRTWSSKELAIHRVSLYIRHLQGQQIHSLNRDYNSKVVVDPFCKEKLDLSISNLNLSNRTSIISRKVELLILSNPS